MNNNGVLLLVTYTCKKKEKKNTASSLHQCSIVVSQPISCRSSSETRLPRTSSGSTPWVTAATSIFHRVEDSSDPDCCSLVTVLLVGCKFTNKHTTKWLPDLSLWMRVRTRFGIIPYFGIQCFPAQTFFSLVATCHSNRQLAATVTSPARQVLKRLSGSPRVFVLFFSPYDTLATCPPGLGPKHCCSHPIAIQSAGEAVIQDW